VTEKEVLDRLQALTDQLGIKMIRKEGEFKGGIYRLRDEQTFLINASLSTSEAIVVLCRELARQDLSKLFVLPAIRELIEVQRDRAN
jgi:hypothetical protein